MFTCLYISRHLQFTLSALVLLSLLMGCAATRGRALESGAAGAVVHVTIRESADGFAEIVQRVIPSMLEEMNVTFAPQAMAGTDLRLDLRMTFRNVTETELEMIWRQTTLVLLTLYPSTCGHRAYMLTATLTDAHGHSRTYEKTDSTLAWLWLLHGSRCGNTPPPDEIASVTERMLAAVFDQMRQDDAFAGIDLAAPDAKAPLVNITLNRATDIAAQVLSVDRTFPHWTIGDDATRLPDYRVNLRFDVQPGSFSIGRAYMGIMTLGLTSPCRGSTIVLTATVTGPRATLTRSYTFTDSLFGRMGAYNNCEIPDESNRPDVFAKLLRKAFQQIAEDKLIEKEAPPAGASLPPLIRVSASRAEGIVRRETLRAGPFARYYFHDNAEYTPDYTFTLDIQFAGGDRKQLSTPAAMGAGMAIAIGVNMFCNPTLMTLDAVLSDNRGEEVRRYHIEREVGFSGNRSPSNCQDDESSNPVAVSELVRSLYAEMQADGTLARITARANPAR